MSFLGAEGVYKINFQPTNDWDGIIDVTINGVDMQWSVDNSDQDESGDIVLGGMTYGSETIWNDLYWFELRLHDRPAIIRYWGDKIIWREDRSVADTDS